MNNVEEKIIMYDSPEAAQQITVTGWVSGGGDKRFWNKDEHMARWAGCTHLKCECGVVLPKTHTRCDECRRKKEIELYTALAYKEWDGVVPVVTFDGDTYFFNEEAISEYMEEHELMDLSLLICEPIYHTPIDSETVCSDAHEDWEPEEVLEDAITAFNKILQSLPPHSWMPGKIRTSYRLNP